MRMRRLHPQTVPRRRRVAMPRVSECRAGRPARSSMRLHRALQQRQFGRIARLAAVGDAVFIIFFGGTDGATVG